MQTVLVQPAKCHVYCASPALVGSAGAVTAAPYSRRLDATCEPSENQSTSYWFFTGVKTA